MKKLVHSRLSLKIVFSLGLGSFLLLALLLVGTLSTSNLLNPTTHAQPATHAISRTQIKLNAPQGPAFNNQTQFVKGAPKDSNLPASSNTVTGLSLKSSITMSGGGCYSNNTSSTDATVVSSGDPQMYGYEGSDAPMLGLIYDRCDNTIIVRLTTGYDYYKVNWWRPGLSGWSQYTTSLEASEFSNAHANTYYQFTVEGCFSHWYGDSCKSWSPRVNISTY